MKHQTNMRGSKHGDPSEFHRLPNLSAIFGNAFTPALGNGLRITYGLETHCRSNSVRSVQPSTLPTRLTVTRGDKAQSPFSIACGILLPRWQWADGLRVSRSRSLSLLMAVKIAPEIEDMEF